MRALDAPRARVLQPRGRADTLAPTALARSAAPRHALPSSQQRAKQPPPRPAGQELAAAADSPCSIQRRPSHPGSPPGPWNSACSSASVSPSSRRRHVPLQLQYDGSPAALIPTTTEPTSACYKWTPRDPLSTHATSCYPHGAPLPRIRPGEASFLISGNSCRRHRPGQSGTSRISPSPVSPPRASTSSREPFPLLDFDREPTPPQSHFATEAFLRRGARRRPLTPSPPTQ